MTLVRIENDFEGHRIEKLPQLNYVNVSVFNNRQNMVPYSKIEPGNEISNKVVCATSKGSDHAAHTQSLIRAFARHLNIL